MEKIVIIGGGSPYVPGILYSFSQIQEEFAGSNICLMDIDSSRLPLMQKLAERMIQETGAGITVTSTTDIEEALPEATFVITNFRPGGIEGLRLDEEIPVKYGIYGQETTGPGGTFFALRSIPPVLELCAKVESICPEAWVVNYVNPVNFVADVIQRKTKVKSISICDGGGNGLKYLLPDLLDVEPHRLNVRAAGVNHHNWLMELTVDGNDAYPMLKSAVNQLSEETADRRKSISVFEEHARFLKQYLETYDIFPANIRYVYPYFNYFDALDRYRAGGHSLYRMFSKDLPEHWENFEKMAKGQIPIYMDPEKHHTRVGHGDIAVQIVTTIATNRTQEFHVNIPNRGCITNLPHGAIVEVPALVDRSGIRPLCMGDLPKGVMGLTSALINWQELSVDAALSGNKDTLMQALLAHPWMRIISLQDARMLGEEMLASHEKHLPQFL